MDIRETSDGSFTLYSSEFGETYHSINGAITESEHVFIDTGLRKCRCNPVNILEMGFGTGLNAFLALMEAEKGNKTICYTSIERYPLAADIYEKLNYANTFPEEKQKLFIDLHRKEWELEVEITSYFALKKLNVDITAFELGNQLYDVVFFDAFSPNIQPELWSREIFGKVFQAMKPGGVLTTYCAKGEVRRNMQSVGFVVERLPGPPGKREMLRANKK
jgi:tRNA U34 5-methylaminomethyl-2-thiouridine-forming methyltransferase MnmC